MTYHKKINLSHEQLEQIITVYKSGLSAKKVGKQFGYSGEFIQKTLRNNGIKLRTRIEINRKHPVKEDFFDVIDSEEKAYFLGFLFADGSVHHKSNAIVLKLQKRDRKILTKFSHLILGTEHLLINKNNYLLRFSSFHIKQRLIELGCMPNKTFILTFPILDPSMYHHFIRGYFDGDGCISLYKADYDVSIISTEDFCISTQSIIANQLDIMSTISKNNKMVARGNTITSYLRYRGNRQVLKLMTWLYKDATIYLERKHQKYLNLKQWTEEVDSRTSQYKNINILA
jgi:intein/homing endonuclease